MKIKGAMDEPARIINIEFPGVCPYNLICLSQSWQYSLKYHTDFRQRWEAHNSWGCVSGGPDMKACSMYRINKIKFIEGLGTIG